MDNDVTKGDCEGNKKKRQLLDLYTTFRPIFQDKLSDKLDHYICLQTSSGVVLSYIRHIQLCAALKSDDGFFAGFVSKNWYRLCTFRSRMGYGFRGNDESV